MRTNSRHGAPKKNASTKNICAEYRRRQKSVYDAPNAKHANAPNAKYANASNAKHANAPFTKHANAKNAKHAKHANAPGKVNHNQKRSTFAQACAYVSTTVFLQQQNKLPSILSIVSIVTRVNTAFESR